MLFTNCVVLVWYGYLSDDIFPLFVTAVMGLVTCGGFITVFYRYTDDKQSVHRICAAAFIVIALVCLYGAIGVEGVTGQIMRTKSTASMPFTLCLANFFNSVCWVIYAIIVVDVWVLLPNAFGCVLTTIQLVLYAVYPTSKVTGTRFDSVMIDHPGIVGNYERQASLSIVFSTTTSQGRKNSIDRKDRLTIVTTLMLRISLLPDFRRMHKNHSTGEMSVMPCLLLFTNCYAVMFYAIAIDNMLPLFATSTLGIVTGVFFNYFFYRWAADKRSVVYAFIGSFVVCVVVTIYSVLAMTGFTGQSHSSIGTTLGFITITTTVGLYVSPMATIARVLRTKKASSMPFTMGVVNVFNSFCWATYATLIGNMFILGPNIAGFILGCTQLILTFIYRPKSTKLVEVVEDAGTLSVVILSPNQTDRENCSAPFESPNFVALSSPCYEESKLQAEANKVEIFSR
ncbi:MtN3-like protein [Phytophthora palmivora]|uniref:Sugar transporter SWEET1 n=1 Tax=Phytophthora palmivora TaxID=4796 RepID=A0A2P4X355_9STRA|nr:MtN3-like protein [Phytophthora palmivora]